MRNWLKVRKKYIINAILIIEALLSSTICIVFFSWKAGLFFSVCFISLLFFKKNDEPVGSVKFILFFSIWAIGCSVLIVIFSQFIIGLDVLFSKPIKVLLNIAIFILFLLFLLALTGRWKGSLIASSLIFALAITANYFVYKFRGFEVTPTDLLSVRTAMNVTSEYVFSIPPILAYFWISLFLTISIGLILPPVQKEPLRIKKRAIVLLLVIGMVTVLFGVTKEVKTYRYGRSGSWANGFFLNFMLELKEIHVKKPEAYSVSMINEIADSTELSNTTVGSERPHIIVIMDESFSDLNVLGQELNCNKEVTPFFDSLLTNVVKGYALSSVFGGNTANSEFEFLTGNTMAFLPHGSVAYQQYIHQPIYSLVSYLENVGYTTYATHPYFSSGYNRERIYPLFGFDKSTFIEDYQQIDLVRGLVSDEEMFQAIIHQYENLPDDQKMFLFGVTMQNHGGYSDGDYAGDIKLNSNRESYPDVQQYLSLIHQSDSAFEHLVQYFQSVDDHVVILFFGDHQPNLTPGFFEYLHGSSFNTISEQELQYMVPFVIWANYEIEAEVVPCTSLNYLSIYLLEAAGIDLPPYQQFLNDIKDTIPAINSVGYYSNEADDFCRIDDADGREKEILDRYAQLQYNYIFDNENRNKVFFPG